VGRKIGSAALVADGMHARTDGLTSLAVLVAAAGTWLGYPIVDPIIGVLIGIAILFITRDATLTMWYRLMDAIEPDLLAEAEEVIKEQPEIKEMRRVRLRWLGHQLHAEVTIAVEANLTIAQGHEIAEKVRHGLFHEFANLSEIIVHVDPWSPGEDSFHETTAHHEQLPQALKG
jgi:cation diffusion facilitator family transporter